MKKIFTLLTFLTLTSALLCGEETDEKQEKVHPAVQALLEWTEVAKDTGRSLRKSFIQPDDLQLIQGMRGAEDGFEREFAKSLDTNKKQLTFEENQGDPLRGLIMSDQRPLLPARKVGGRWQFDSEAAEKMLAKARIEIAKTDMQAFISALEQYKTIGGSYPSNEQGLNSLWQKPTTAPRPRRWVQMVKKPDAFIDPWGAPYQYQLKEGKPHLSSLGPDGKVSGDDIISPE